MSDRPKVIAFDVDLESLVSIRQAFSEWEIEVRNRAATGSLVADESPEAADLLVLGASDQAGETAALCRILRSQAVWAQTALLVLVRPAQEGLVRAALAAGAHSCLVLPVHAKELVSMVNRVHEGNRPGRHTLNLDRAQRADQWRDHGGEA
jgi:DNA-binding NarL/FixJ family response regulator